MISSFGDFYELLEDCRKQRFQKTCCFFEIYVKHIQINLQLGTIEEEPPLSNTKYKKKKQIVEKATLLEEEKDQNKSQNEPSPTEVDQASELAQNVEDSVSEDQDDSMKLRSGKRVHFKE